MNGREAITRVSTFLADQLSGDEFSRWSETELFYAFQYALNQVALASPAVFNGVAKVPLRAGSLQQLPKCCNRLVDTVSNLRKTSRKANRLVTRKSVCRINNNIPYKPRSYSYDPEATPDIFYLYPPIPDNAQVDDMEIICNKNPNVDNLDEDVPMTSPMESCVIDLMIFYVCSGENESASHVQTAERHFRSAMTLLGLETKEMDRNYQKRLMERKSGIV